MSSFVIIKLSQKTKRVTSMFDNLIITGTNKIIKFLKKLAEIGFFEKLQY